MNTNSHNNTEDHTPQHTHRGTEVWGRRESGRALMSAVTEPQVIRQLRVMGHRWRIQPRQDWEIETDLVASATGNHITNNITNTTQIGPPPPPAPRLSDYPCSSANAAPTPPPTMAERAHPCNNNRGQPRTAKDSPKKTPGAPRILGDEPTDTLQGRGRRPRTPPFPQLRGRAQRGTSPGPELLD